MSQHHEGLVEAVKSSPAVTTAGALLAGYTLQDWVLITTLIYTLLQIGWLVYSKFIRRDKEE